MALSQINQATSTLADLVSKLNTFLTTGGGGNPGWTGDAHVPASGQWALSKDEPGGDTVEVAFQWDTASPNALGIYQYHTGLGAGSGYNSGGGTDPTDQDGDSGNGYVGTINDTNLLTSRHAPVTNTPSAYWCFAGETHAHVVVLLANGIDYVHFGFGYATKTNDWDGGEYSYGWKYSTGVLNPLSTMLWDGVANGSNMENFVATMRMEGMTDSPAGGLWGVMMGPQGAGSLGQDRQGSPVDRIHIRGGFRGSSHAAFFGGMAGTLSQGFVPTYPIIAYHYDRDISGSSQMVASITPPMAILPDVRGIHMKSFQPGDTVTIGADTWYIFPAKRWSDSSTSGTTGVQGIMYKAN